MDQNYHECIMLCSDPPQFVNEDGSPCERCQPRMRLFVGGGQEYHGPTAERDKEVVKQVAKALARFKGSEVQIVTGGMPGIPDDFAAAWTAAGGSQVLCVVSSEYEEAFRARNLPYACVVVGATQTARRLAVTQWQGLEAAFFVQGGKYTTHEMRLLSERGVPIVAFHGSGGAAGGEQPYEGWSYPIIPYDEDTKNYIGSRDPHMLPVHIGMELFNQLLKALKK